MKLKSLLLACLALLAAPLFAEVGGGSANNGNTSTQTSAGTVNAPNGIYTVTVAPTGTTVAALDGEVTLTKADGTTVRIDIGTGLVIGPDGQATTQSLKDIVAAEKAAGNATSANSVTASLGQALQTVADNTKAGAYGNGAVTLLASLVKVLVTANPDAAASYAGTAVSGATAAGSGVANKTGAITAIWESTKAARTGRPGANTPDAAIYGAIAGAAAANNVSVASAHLTNILIDMGRASSTPITPIDPTVVTVSPSGGQQ